MKIKQLSRQICDLFNQGSEQHEFSVFTIQKRIYDVCLVLKTVGTIGMINKQVYFTHQGPEELRSVWMRKCPKKIAETEERIRRKKNAVFKLKEALNVMRVLQKKRRCRMEPENEETISTENLIALFMNPADVEINNGIVSDTISRVSIRDPKNILSVVDLFLHLCWRSWLYVCKHIKYHIQRSYFSVRFLFLGLESAPLGLNLLIIVHNSLKFLHLDLIFLQLGRKLINNRHEHYKNSDKLDGGGFMAVVENTDEDGEYFASGNHEGHNVLLELLYHPVHEKLAQAAE